MPAHHCDNRHMANDHRDRAERFSEAVRPLLRALEAVGLDTADFGVVGSINQSTFDSAQAAPILIEWLPLIDEPYVVETIARSLTGQPEARGEGARQLIRSFARMPASGLSAKWAIANALSAIAGSSDADGLIRLLQDRRHGTARQMLCPALSRTHDPRAAHVLIDLIDDDDVSGHAVLELRRLGRSGGFPDPKRARPRLEQLIQRPAASQFAKKQARSALATLADP